MNRNLGSGSACAVCLGQVIPSLWKKLASEFILLFPIACIVLYYCTHNSQHVLSTYCVLYLYRSLNPHNNAGR